jgi:DNA-binding IclR family transcriptional regulator
MQSTSARNRDDTNPATPPGSLNRAALLITAIARGSRKGSALTELVARTGLPRPTIHRVLDMLMALGWVERDAQTARFNLGADLAALGYSAITRHPLERIASTELSRLAEDLHQVVYLGVRSGLDVVCIGRFESGSQIQVGKGHVGMRGPLGMSPSCMAMFAHLPPAEVDEIAAANMSRYHRIEGFDEHGFRLTLAAAMRNGYGTYDDIVLDRTTSGFGVAILDRAAYPIAAIGTTYISGWLDDEQKQACLSKLQQASARITQHLFPAEPG